MTEVDFYGESFTLADDIDEWTLMEFAEGMNQAESSPLVGLGVIMTLLKEVVPQQDWARFRKTAKANKAGFNEVLPIAVSVFDKRAVEVGRPTLRSTDSSDGPCGTEQPSMSSYSVKAIALNDGRPDLQLFYKRADEAQRAS